MKSEIPLSILFTTIRQNCNHEKFSPQRHRDIKTQSIEPLKTPAAAKPLADRSDGKLGVGGCNFVADY